MQKYPVKCPDPAGPPGLIRGKMSSEGADDLLREESGRVKPVQRPFSYDDDRGADTAGELGEFDNVMTYRSDADGWGEFGPSPTRPQQKIHPYGEIEGTDRPHIPDYGKW
jgi:hypothetical protein